MSVTAGLICAPEIPPTTYTAMATPSPQPRVIMIQPESNEYDFFRLTPALTPQPSSIKIIVPINSPRYADMVYEICHLSLAKVVILLEILVKLNYLLKSKFHTLNLFINSFLVPFE